MEFFKKTTFWMGFSAALLASLLVGGLLSAMLSKCPAFGPLLAISIGVALLGGLLAQQIFKSKVDRVTEAAVERVSAPIQRLSQARERLSRESIEDRITRAREQLQRLSE